MAAARAEIEAEIAGSTLLTEFAETVAQAPDVVAHRWQADGEWRSLTYRQLHDQVRDAALGLVAAGLRPGEFAAVWSRNRSEATIADYAVMHARGVPVFIYPTVAPEQAADIISHCAATVVIVEREFLPVLDSIRDRLPQLRAVVVLGDGPSGEAEAGEGTLGWQALLDLGHAEAELDPGAFERGWRQVTPDTLATLIYTSGTTGSPKAVMITHRNVRYSQQATLRVIPLEHLVAEDGTATLVSYLPMAHVTGRHVDHWGPWPPGHPGLLPRPAKTLRGRRPGPADRADRHPPGMGEAARRLAWRAARRDPAAVAALPDAVKQAVLTRIGLDRCRIATTGAAPIDPEIVEFFRALGVPLTEGWGMSELSNAATLAAPDTPAPARSARRFPVSRCASPTTARSWSAARW